MRQKENTEYGQETETTTSELTLLSHSSSLPQLPSSVIFHLTNCRKGRKQPCSRSTSNSSNRTSRRCKATVFKLEPQSSNSTSLTTKRLTVCNVLHFLPVILEVHAHTPSEKELFGVWMHENSNNPENKAACTRKSQRKAQGKAACFQEILVSF